MTFSNIDKIELFRIVNEMKKSSITNNKKRVDFVKLGFKFDTLVDHTYFQVANLTVLTLRTSIKKLTKVAN